MINSYIQQGGNLLQTGAWHPAPPMVTTMSNTDADVQDTTFCQAYSLLRLVRDCGTTKSKHIANYLKQRLSTSHCTDGANSE